MNSEKKIALCGIADPLWSVLKCYWKNVPQKCQQNIKLQMITIYPQVRSWVNAC